MRKKKERQPLDSEEEDNVEVNYQPSDSDQELDEDDKLILKKTRQELHGRGGSDSESEEEILPLQSSSEESDDDEEDDSEDESFDEDEDNDVLGDDEGNLPDPKAWGQKRKNYYDTDYVDQDFGGFQNEKDEEAALMEEEEARAIQRRLAEQLDDLDPVLTFATLGDLTKVVDDADDKREIIETDFSQMNERDRMVLLEKESPEFLGFINDFQSYLDCVQDNLLSIVTTLKANQLPSSSGAQFVLSMTQLIMNYITNISFYLLLKARNSNVKNHPVMKQLLQYKELIKEMEPVYQRHIQPQLDTVMAKISESEISLNLDNASLIKSKKKRKLLNLLINSNIHGKKQKLNKEDKMLEKCTMNGSFEHEKSEEDVESEESELDTDDDPKEETTGNKRKENEGTDNKDDKRAITYQIAKNKGLTPRRKKENRNPRVKLKNKFRKAKIRRKGQIREVKREVKRYGGEASGIKASVTKSIKIKY